MDVFDKSISDFKRAQALYEVFIEMASEIETSSQFFPVMTRIADNLAILGCKAKPCTQHCEPCTLEHAQPCTLPHFFVTPQPCLLSHVDPCTLSHAEPCTLAHNDPCTLSHVEPCTLAHNDPCTFPHINPCTFPHIDPCTLLHIDPCTLSHAEPCTLPHNDICMLNHFPVEPVTVAVTIPCPLAHNDLCTKEHVNSRPSSPSPVPRQLKRKCFKKKQKAKTTDILSDNSDMDYFKGFGSEPEMDLDGFFANPNYDLSVALEEFKKCGGSAEELHKFCLLYEELHAPGGACHIPYKRDDPLTTPSVSLPKRNRDHNTQTHPLPTTKISSPTTQNPLPPASTSTLPIGVLTPHCQSDPPLIPKVSLPRAQTEPLPPNNSTTIFPPRAQTAPPDISRNTLTAHRCTNKDASPSSFVKFMDVPVTMTREHIHDCLQNNRKWSTVDISNVEIFAIKNKDSNVVNVLKIKFKDDAQSTTAKRVLTTSISFGDTISRRCRPWYLSTRSN
ncbi:hypothetical protein JOM56_006734 [Amanita muscaria]